MGTLTLRTLTGLLDTARARWALRRNQQPLTGHAPPAMPVSSAPIYAHGRAQVHRPRHSAEARNELTMPIVVPPAIPYPTDAGTPWIRQRQPVNQRHH